MVGRRELWNSLQRGLRVENPRFPINPCIYSLKIDRDNNDAMYEVNDQAGGVCLEMGVVKHVNRGA
jgi:hypothetical protein